MSKSNRFLHNADCNAMFYAPRQWQPEGGPYSVEAIRRYVNQAADVGYDTFLCNPNGSCPLYPSKTVRSALEGYTRGDLSFPRRGSPEKDRSMVALYDLYLDLLEAGVDWLAEVAAMCRARGMAPWLTIRMNDQHGWRIPEAPENCDLYHDPRFRLSGRMPNPDAAGPDRRTMGGLNYECKEVRDHMFALIRETVEEYDYEGLELDWIRGLRCCEPNPSQKTIDTITAWHAEIRAMTETHAAKTGRPFKLGLRSLGHLGQMRSVGIDVDAMAREGVLDFVSAGGSHAACWDVPFDELRRRLGSDVRLYGMINTEHNWLPCYDPATEARVQRRLHLSPEALWANAAGKLALDADGLETFNFFFQPDPTRPEGHQFDFFDAFRDVADLEKLRGRPKHYCFNTINDNTAIIPNKDVPEQLPQLMRPRWRRLFRLPMCREPEGSQRELIIQVAVEDQETLLRMGVSFNGSWPNFDAVETQELLYPAVSRKFAAARAQNDVMLTHYMPEHRAFNYTFPASAIREGWNDITLYYGGADPVVGHAKEHQNPPVCVVNIELAVR